MRRVNLRILAAWVLTLLISALPDILWRQTTGHLPAWLLEGKLILLAAMILTGLAWRVLRPLRQFALVFLVFYSAEWATGWVRGSTPWQSWFGTSLSASLFQEQLLKLAVALAVVATMLVLKGPRSEFYLVMGRNDSPFQPVWWLWTSRPVPWHHIGLVLSLCIGLGLLVFLGMAGKPDPATLLKAMPWLPVVGLFAAMNAFGEEMCCRASLLATLRDAAGERQALWLTAVCFGLAHFYGVPYGVIGVVMAGWLGLVLGKAMLETRGFFWAWFIHFVQDVLIFPFLVVGSITPGGTANAPAQVRDTYHSPSVSGAIARVTPDPPVAGRNVLITYAVANGPLAGSTNLTVHNGFDGWNQTTDVPMIASGNGEWRTTLKLPTNIRQFDFAFTDGSRWDNNGGQDWHIPTQK